MSWLTDLAGNLAVKALKSEAQNHTMEKIGSIVHPLNSYNGIFNLDARNPTTFGNGLRNGWYRLTGQSHLTDLYKHEENIELNRNQLTAQDMMKAGLSKYAMTASGVGSVGAASGNPGMDLLSMIQGFQAIRQNALDYQKDKYDLNLSEKLGIRTDDSNELSKIGSIAKVLFGYDLDDLPENGLLGSFLDSLGFGNKGTNTRNIVDAGASGGNTASSVVSHEPMVYISKDNPITISDLLKRDDKRGTYAFVRDKILQFKSMFDHNVSMFFTSTGNMTSYGEEYCADFAKRCWMSFDDCVRMVTEWYFDAETGNVGSGYAGGGGRAL